MIHDNVFPQELLQWLLISRGFSSHRHTNAGSSVFLLKNLITRWCRKEFTVHKRGSYCLAMHDGSHLAMLVSWPRLTKEGSGTPMKVSRSKISHPQRPHEIRYIHGLIFPGTWKFRFIRCFHIHRENNMCPKNVLMWNTIWKLGIVLSNPSVLGYDAMGGRYDVPHYDCKMTL